ncbi:MarR family winged helix-turn-helix transcriptional regulator [Aquipseudomonas alcaligenes]|jgi:DNA-binding MarR family transcriptional regulator|uniref:MarR family winged helix-turn-helix transcriptional regulator n=1 Tax=Aquipseudomonas alcaligenes TaxID=43263 RepID=UPI003651C978
MQDTDQELFQNVLLYEQLRIASLESFRFQTKQLLKAGLKINDYQILICIAQKPNISQVAAGAMLDLDRTTVTKAIDNLEKLGLARRLPDPRTRRANQLVPTERGLEYARIYKRMFLQAQPLFAEELTVDELNTLISLLAKLNQPRVRP